MGERDAFGRDKDEDTLKEMGWRASGDPLAKPKPATPDPATSVFAAGEASAPFLRSKRAPAAAAAPAQPAPPPAPAPARLDAAPKPPPPAASAFKRRRPRRRGPSLARLIVLIAIVGVGVIGIGTAVDAGRGVVDGIDGVISPSAPPDAASADSLLRASALRAALDKLPKGRVVSPLRIAPDRINAQVIGGTTRHIVQILADGTRIDVKAPVGVSQHALPKVATGAPTRIVRTAARRAGRPAADVDYLVLTDDGWVLFFKGGSPVYRATPAGRNVKKIG